MMSNADIAAPARQHQAVPTKASSDFPKISGSRSPLEDKPTVLAQAARTRLFAPASLPAQPLQLGAEGQAAIRQVFGFDPTRSSAGPVANVFSYGNSDTNPLSPRGSIGYSDINSGGQASAFVSLQSTRQLEAKLGLPRATETIAAQEVAQKIIASHPELRGKLTAQQSELIGNAVSLTMNEGFLSINILNTIQSGRNPAYGGIAEVQLESLGRTNQGLRLGGEGAHNGGADLMNRFIQHLKSTGAGETGINAASLRGFAESLGTSPNLFMKTLGGETQGLMKQVSRSIIEKARALPNL